MQNAPVLYIISTPIGNLADITLRAIETLKAVDVIAVEDTRHSKKLLSHFNIEKPLIVYEEHSEGKQAQRILKELSEHKSVGLISDAGTPLISDPGFDVVNAAIQEGYDVVPIPGACAAMTALSVSGLPTNQFAFAGFLPPKSQARQKYLSTFVDSERTIIFYESPHRILHSLEDMLTVLGDTRKIVIARELTKLHESLYRGELKTVFDTVKQDKNAQLGEFVILVEGKPKLAETDLTQEDKDLVLLLAKELPPNKAAGLAAKITNKRRNTFYAFLCEN